MGALLGDKHVLDRLSRAQRNVPVRAREGAVEGKRDVLLHGEGAVRLDGDSDAGLREGEGLGQRLARGREANDQERDCERRAPQNCTRGASRAAGSSTSKYSRALKLNMFPTMFVGTVSSAVS